MGKGEFGATLREYRGRAGYTIARVAEYLGRTKSYVSDLENGRRLPPRSLRLVHFTKLFGLSDQESQLLYELGAIERGSVELSTKDRGEQCARVAAALASQWDDMSQVTLDWLEDVLTGDVAEESNG